MAKKPRGLKSRAIPRSLSVSLAGIRAGGALAVLAALLPGAAGRHGARHAVPVPAAAVVGHQFQGPAYPGLQ
ncbi:MAG: hypothetical protein KDI34_01680, partial [Halioglobus sp.]|nr:hypothetical protein [Halioglobus sp.]